jgi:hypothetical protein
MFLATFSKLIRSPCSLEDYYFAAVKLSSWAETRSVICSVACLVQSADFREKKTFFAAKKFLFKSRANLVRLKMRHLQFRRKDLFVDKATEKVRVGPTRVTRFGEFSPCIRFFTLGIF